MRIAWNKQPETYCPPARGYRRNRFDQVADRSERPLAAHPLDASCDPVRSVQFAVIPENPDQFSRFVTVHYVRSRKPGTLIHPHVERSVETERESALPRIEMVRRHAQIGQHPVHLFVSVQAQLPRMKRKFDSMNVKRASSGTLRRASLSWSNPSRRPFAESRSRIPANARRRRKSDRHTFRRDVCLANRYFRRTALAHGRTP